MVTMVEKEKIDAFRTLQGEKINEAKTELAFAVTEFVHGSEEADKCKRMALSVFAKGNIVPLDAPKIELDFGFIGTKIRIIDMMADAKLVASKGEARRLIASGGCFVENRKVLEEEEEILIDEKIGENGLFLRMGKKKHFHIVFVPPSPSA
jgi:tyrosyl-tRNA synthetase